MEVIIFSFPITILKQHYIHTDEERLTDENATKTENLPPSVIIFTDFGDARCGKEQRLKTRKSCCAGSGKEAACTPEPGRERKGRILISATLVSAVRPPLVPL